MESMSVLNGISLLMVKRTMQTGWFEDGGLSTFYLRSSGRMVKGEGVETIDGRTYVFSYQHYVLKNRKYHDRRQELYH